MTAQNEQTLRIADSGRVLSLTYDDAVAAHHGQSWFGVAVGFRMLQAAAEALSGERLWDRNHLFVVSGHPGQGVRDVIEYVTCCLSRNHFRLDDGSSGCGCGRGMQFAWEVGDGDLTASLRLREDFVPETLFELLDRRGTPAERPDDNARFSALKRRLAEQIWDEPLEQLFNVNLTYAEAAGHA